jgi:serine protease inhibitor
MYSPSKIRLLGTSIRHLAKFSSRRARSAASHVHSDPCLFLIADLRTGTLLFLGRIANPAG